MSSTTTPAGTKAPGTESRINRNALILDIPIPARSARSSKAERSETGVWVAIAAISMTFAALTSAMIVREGAAPDWRHFQIPPILYFNTLILVTSSFTLELSRRRFAPDSASAGEGARREEGDRPDMGLPALAPYWLWVTLALGLIFISGQYLAWRNLAAQGLFLATSPSSSFFYLLTALHGLHLLGGVGGLLYVLRRLTRTDGPAQRSALGALSLYWHFMDVLWIYLLLVLVIRM